MSAYVDLERFAAGVEKLGTMAADVAKAAEKPVADVVRESARAAKTPDGRSWPELVEGGMALRRSPDAVDSSTKGKRIELKIGMPFVYHQHGAGGSSTTKEAERARARIRARQEATGKASKFHAPKRQILPEAGDPLPPKMGEAIEKAAKDVFDRAMGGR